MKNYITDTENAKMEAANYFWAWQRERVLRVAAEHNLTNLKIKEHDDEFLFDLCDNGDYVPSDEEILDAVVAYVFG